MSFSEYKMRVTNVFVLLVLICAAVGQELPKPEATWLPLSEMGV